MLSSKICSKTLCVGDVVTLLFSTGRYHSLVAAMNKIYTNARVILLSNECAQDVFFVPKYFCKPIICICDNMNEKSVNDSGLLSLEHQSA